MNDNKVLEYHCDDCKYKWLETTYKSMEYREGYSCPKCGKKSIGSKEVPTASKTLDKFFGGLNLN